MLNRTVANILNENKIYSGFLKLFKYDLEVSSLKPEKESLNFLQREIVRSLDAVHVLLYSSEKESFLLCKEFRAGPLMNQHNDHPFLLTIVSGAIEKNETPEQAAYKEVLEETGIKAPPLEAIAQVYKSPGITTEKAYFFYGEITESIKTGIFGIGDEEIQTQLLSRTKAMAMLDEGRILDGATWMALTWFRSFHGK